MLDKKYYEDNKLGDDKVSLYVGIYKSSRNEERKIISKNGHLFLSQPSGRNSKLYHYEKGDFYLENSYETIEFKSIESGKT